MKNSIPIAALPEDIFGVAISKSLQMWIDRDDCCHVEPEKGFIVSYHETRHNSQWHKNDEVEFILNRIRSLYEAGGAIEEIRIVPKNTNSYDNRIAYENSLRTKKCKEIIKQAFFTLDKPGGFDGDLGEVIEDLVVNLKTTLSTENGE